MMRHLITFPIVAAFVVSCSPSVNTSQNNYLRSYAPSQQRLHHSDPVAQSFWDGDSVSGAPLIRIIRAEQKAYFYKSGQLVGVSSISTGKEGHGTPAGNFKISQKNADHRSSIYGVFKDPATGKVVDDDVDIRTDKVPPGLIYEAAPMLNFMRFNGGVGMHTGYLPGYAASHGCVRMPAHMSKHFFDNVQVGTPVIVE